MCNDKIDIISKIANLKNDAETDVNQKNIFNKILPGKHALNWIRNNPPIIRELKPLTINDMYNPHDLNSL